MSLAEAKSPSPLSRSKQSITSVPPAVGRLMQWSSGPNAALRSATSAERPLGF